LRTTVSTFSVGTSPVEISSTISVGWLTSTLTSGWSTSMITSSPPETDTSSGVTSGGVGSF
jgi:hypothetical protein